MYAMKRIIIVSLATIAVTAVACRDTAAPTSQLAVNMASTFSVAPAGFNQLSTSFVGSEGIGAFEPTFDRGEGWRGGFGPPSIGPGFDLGFMGGGLMGEFLGEGLFFFGMDQNCSYSSGTGVTTCAFTTRDGLAVTRTFEFTTSSGRPESKVDSTTNTIATTSSVTGTVTRRDSSSSVVNESSSQTVSGLAAGITQRTVNGASAGSETTTGNSRQGAFTAKRVSGDTIQGLVIPFHSTTSVYPYPTAGTVTRAMSATVSITGQSPANASRREVITYDGSATAKVVITMNGTTQNCTLPLPHGRLSCS
jgi:hypothetical protein